MVNTFFLQKKLVLLLLLEVCFCHRHLIDFLLHIASFRLLLTVPNVFEYMSSEASAAAIYLLAVINLFCLTATADIWEIVNNKELTF